MWQSMSECLLDMSSKVSLRYLDLYQFENKNTWRVLELFSSKRGISQPHFKKGLVIFYVSSSLLNFLFFWICEIGAKVMTGMKFEFCRQLWGLASGKETPLCVICSFGAEHEIKWAGFFFYVSNLNFTYVYVHK